MHGWLWRQGWWVMLWCAARRVVEEGHGHWTPWQHDVVVMLLWWRQNNKKCYTREIEAVLEKRIEDRRRWVKKICKTVDSKRCWYHKYHQPKVLFLRELWSELKFNITFQKHHKTTIALYITSALHSNTMDRQSVIFVWENLDATYLHCCRSGFFGPIVSRVDDRYVS